MADKHEPRFDLPADIETTIYNGYIEAPVKDADATFTIPTTQNNPGQNFRVHLIPVLSGGSNAGKCMVQKAEVVPVGTGISVNYHINLTDAGAGLAGLGYILFTN